LRRTPGGAAGSIVSPLLNYHSEHYRALREIHEPLLKSIEKITGERAEFIQWNGTGPAQPRESLSVGFHEGLVGG
jgi:hypothetical protein